MAHIRQSGPDAGLGFQVKVVKAFQVAPSSLGSGPAMSAGAPTATTNAPTAPALNQPTILKSTLWVRGKNLSTFQLQSAREHQTGEPEQSDMPEPAEQLDHARPFEPQSKVHF